MSLTRSVARNTLSQAVGRALSIGLALVVFFMVARHLGVEGYGYYTTVTAFLQLFGLVVDLGLYIYLAKTLGQPGVDEARMVGNILTLRLVSATLILGLAPLLVFFFPYPSVVKVGVAAMSLSSLFVTVTQVLSGVFQQRLRAAKFIIGEVIGRLVLLGATLVAIRSGAGILGIIWTVVFGSFVAMIITAWWAYRLIPFKLGFDGGVWKQIIRSTWPIALSIMFNVIYFKADTIILSLYYPAYEVGIYGAPYRVFEALISIPALFAGLLTPLLTTAYLTDRPRFGRMLQRGFEALVLMAAPLVVGTQFVATDVMRLVAPEFAASAPVLRILVFGTAAIFIGYLFSNAVVVVNRQRAMVWVYATVAFSSVALYVATIPRFSYFGAATVTVLVESVVAVAAAWMVLRTADVRFSLSPTARILVASGLMATAMWFGRGLAWTIDGVLGVAVYAAAVVGLRVVDRATLREIITRSP